MINEYEALQRKADFLRKDAQKMWDEEILPELKALKNKKNRVWDDEKPTLTIKNVAKLMNTHVSYFKNWLVRNQHIQTATMEGSTPSDDLTSKGWATLTVRRFGTGDKAHDVNITKLTLEGTAQLGAMFLTARNGNRI